MRECHEASDSSKESIRRLPQPIIYAEIADYGGMIRTRVFGSAMAIHKDGVGEVTILENLKPSQEIGVSAWEYPHDGVRTRGVFTRSLELGVHRLRQHAEMGGLAIEFCR